MFSPARRSVSQAIQQATPSYSTQATSACRRSLAYADAQPSSVSSSFSARSRSINHGVSPAGSPSRITTRNFFSLPDISKIAKLAGSAAEAVASGSAGEGQVQNDGDRQTYHARKILPYSQEQLYNLVANIPSYSTFIPFCVSSNVLKATDSNSGGTVARSPDPGWTPPSSGSEPFQVDAELKVGFGGFDEAYISRVVGRPYESVSASAGQAALFRSLSTTWSFAPASGLSPHPSNTIPSSSSSDASPRPTQSLDAPDPKQGPTLLTIDLAFEFTNPLHRIASQAVLPKVADKMVNAFEERCLEVYGKGLD